VTKSSFPPHKNLVRHLTYDENPAVRLRDNETTAVRQGGNDFDRAGTSAKDVLSDYIEALVIHVSTEVASKRSGALFDKFHEEVIILVPTLPHSLKTTILQVCCPLSFFRSC
jgi:hypothetical protein